MPVELGSEDEYKITAKFMYLKFPRKIVAWTSKIFPNCHHNGAIFDAVTSSQWPSSIDLICNFIKANI